MTVDFWMGAVWTIVAVCLGVVIGGIAVLFLADREIPGDGGGGGYEPLWPDDDQDPDDPMNVDLFLYLFEIHAGKMFEANLLERR